jgi:hypothetical protein
MYYKGTMILDLIDAYSLSFSKGNAIKYLCRAGRKDGSTELADLNKALVYVQRAIDAIESKGAPPAPRVESKAQEEAQEEAPKEHNQC